MPRGLHDNDTSPSSDACDALAYSIGVMRSHQSAMARARRRLGSWRGFGKPMFTIKDDDSAITWDSEAMANLPFRPTIPPHVAVSHGGGVGDKRLA